MSVFINHYPLGVSMSAPGVGDSVVSLNRDIGHLLSTRGFVRDGRHGQRYIKRTAHEELRGSDGITVNIHATWNWDLEWHSDRVWLVPLPGSRYISAESLDQRTIRGWLRSSTAQGHPAINLSDGRRARLRCEGNGVLRRSGRAWLPCTARNWHLTFSMKELSYLGVSTRAFRESQLDFRKIHDRFRGGPLSDVGEKARPYEVREEQLGRISGNHLEFARGRRGRAPSQVRKLGCLRTPPKSVQFVVLAPKLRDREEGRRLRDLLRVHFFPEDELRRTPFGPRALNRWLKGKQQHTIVGSWERLGLPPFAAPTKVFRYDPRLGIIRPGDLRTLKDLLAERDSEWSRIAVVVVPEELSSEANAALQRQLGRITRSTIRMPTLASLSWAVVNFVEKLVFLAGGLPYRITDLPGADGATVFIGVDLGHDHSRDRSNIGLALYSAGGESRESRVVRCPRNDERIPTPVIESDLRDLIVNRYPNPRRVIIHRDGRFLSGEHEALTETFSDIAPLVLVSIKKDTCTRLWLDVDESDGFFVRLSRSRAALLTKTQKRGTPAAYKPVEVEVCHPEDGDLETAAAQIFWLARAPGRVGGLPATISLANELARTGSSRAPRNRPSG